MMLLLLVSILANFPMTLPVAAQQQDNTAPPLPAPSSVTVTGNFLNQLGCNDNDPNCAQTALTAWTNTGFGPGRSLSPPAPIRFGLWPMPISSVCWEKMAILRRRHRL